MQARKQTSEQRRDTDKVNVFEVRKKMAKARAEAKRDGRSVPPEAFVETRETPSEPPPRAA